MSNITIEPKRLQGSITPPPDKSISHRSIIIGSLARGKTQIRNLSVSDDCQRTLDAFRSMGISITRNKNLTYVQGKGLNGLRSPHKDNLYLGNSGTSMRLILGVLAGQKFSCRLSGDISLSRRPMKRVVEPLSLMGAKIEAREGEFAPLTVQGGRLKPIDYKTPVASAQVKSAILLAALYARGRTKVTEPFKSRDHTERMLKRFGADISLKNLSVFLQGVANLSSRDVDIPGDISSAGFFLVGGCISKGSEVLVESVGLNPTRSAILEVLKKMGADIRWDYQNNGRQYLDEPKGRVQVRYSHLRAVTITPAMVPSLIDELPILMVAATQAEGESVIQKAQELRFKETDRIRAMVGNLSKMGADIRSVDNDIIIRGPARLSGSTVESFQDHRTSMSLAIAALVACGRTTIKNVDCVKVSFPGFFETFSKLLS